MANPTGKGGFQNGNKAWQKAHHTNKQRARVVAIYRSQFTDDELKTIIAKNKRDALGLRLVTLADGTQKLEDDPNSDGSVRARARQQIYEYLMGKAPQPVELEEGRDIDTLLDTLDESQLDALIAVGTQALPENKSN